MNTNNTNTTAISCKVVLIGESGVGKTSIISRYVKNSYTSDCPPTPGASFASRVVNYPDIDKVIKFDIWDTAGQEKYRSLAKIYYQNCNVAILVYDITRKSSFEEIKNFWYSVVKENVNNKDLLIAIAANKCDMYDLEEIEEVKVRSWAKDIGAIFKYTSAKNSIGIDDLFEIIGNHILNIDNPDMSSMCANESVRIDKSRHSKVKVKKKCSC